MSGRGYSLELELMHSEVILAHLGLLQILFKNLAQLVLVSEEFEDILKPQK
jgi:hypothetical protein